MSDFNERWRNLPTQKAQRFVEGVRYAILARGSTFDKNHLENIKELLEITHHLEHGDEGREEKRRTDGLPEHRARTRDG
jgi:hypothetical protein